MNKTVSIVLILLGSIVGSHPVYAELLDPTRPPPNIQGDTAISPTLFVLNAIIIARDRKIAVINGLNMKIGDVMLGERITTIDENTVQLEGPSGKITLLLFDKPIKRLLQNRW